MAEDEPAGPAGPPDRSPFVARVSRATNATEGQPMTLAVNTGRIYVFDAESGEGRYAS